MASLDALARAMFFGGSCSWREGKKLELYYGSREVPIASTIPVSHLQAPTLAGSRQKPATSSRTSAVLPAKACVYTKTSDEMPGAMLVWHPLFTQV